MTGANDPDFAARREQAKEFINRLDADTVDVNPQRTGFFDQVYNNADGDAAMVPWADMEPKAKLVEWLDGRDGENRTALDVGCGLGDNAERLAAAGFTVTAFDFMPKAINWAKQRFPDTKVDYQVADLFDLPSQWQEAFDLVFECYTLQSIPPQTLEQSIPALAALVKPGGTLLIYTRIRDDGAEVDGPPWPLEISKTIEFARHGFEPASSEEFEIERYGNKRRHLFSEWRRNQP